MTQGSGWNICQGRAPGQGDTNLKTWHFKVVKSVMEVFMLS